MKKLFCIVLSAILLVSMAACGGGSNAPAASTAPAPAPAPASSEAPSAAPEAPAEKPAGPIAIIVPEATHGWTAAVAYHSERKCVEMGWQTGSDYVLLTSGSINEQANQIEEMIGRGVSAIVLMPHNNELTVTAQKITDAGIPMVLFDRKVESDFTAYVGGDNIQIGNESAKYMGEKLGGEGTIAVMHVPTTGSVSAERVQGFVDEMAASYPNIRLIDVTASGFTQEGGLEMTTDMLVANPKLDAIYSINDVPSLGVLQAVVESGRTEIQFISGAGGAQAWFEKIGSTDNINLFTATYSPAMIKDAIQIASDIVDGKQVPEVTIVPTTLVDKSNVANFIDPDSPY